MYYIVYVAATVATLKTLLPKRRNFEANCEELISKLPRGHYERLHRLTDEDCNDKEFWEESMKTLGTLERIRVSTIWFKLVQAYWRNKRIDTDDAQQVLSRLAAQIGNSILALPEAGFCRLFGKGRHAAAKNALTCYCGVIMKTYCLCATEDAPECIAVLGQML